MTDITELPKQMRDRADYGLSRDTADEVHNWAIEIDRALPKWNQITDDSDTWPDDMQEVWFEPRNKCSYLIACSKHLYAMYIGCWWRPTCGIDFPPKDDNE
jgi:hypothetical protein